MFQSRISREVLKFTDNKACFVAGTLVQTNNGLKAIEDFEIGDKVLPKDENTGEITYKRVLNTKETPLKEIYKVTIENISGKIETFSTTDEHPFWIQDFGWMRAADLESGYVLLDSNNQEAVVLSLEHTQDVQTVYNIEVANFHTYFIGESGIWVHNDDCWGVKLNDEYNAKMKDKNLTDAEKKAYDEEFLGKVNAFRQLDDHIYRANTKNKDAIESGDMKASSVDDYSVYTTTRNGETVTAVRRKDSDVGEKYTLKNGTLVKGKAGLNRPKPSVSVKNDVHQNWKNNQQDEFGDAYIKDKDGKTVLDTSKYHHGHKEGFENWRILEMAESKGWKQEHVNKFMNKKGDWYEVEPAKDNMKHLNEDTKPFGKGDEEKTISDAMELFKSENPNLWGSK